MAAPAWITGTSSACCHLRRGPARPGQGADDPDVTVPDNPSPAADHYVCFADLQR